MDMIHTDLSFDPIQRWGVSNVVILGSTTGGVVIKGKGKVVPVFN
jgi:hypothetical protein